MRGTKVFVGVLFLLLIAILIFAPKHKIYDGKTLEYMDSDQIYELFVDNGFEMPQEVIDSYGDKSRIFFDDFFLKCSHPIKTESYIYRKDYLIEKEPNEALIKEILSVYKNIDDKYK